jgi:prepilin-type N-terminal cleavage/methylation domain-containing protein
MPFNIQSHPTSAGSSRAFTLLEVLVASAIMGIVMFVLVSTANTSLQLWRGTSEKMAVDREGRSGLSIVAWDLNNIVVPPWPLPKVVPDTNLASFTPQERALFNSYTNFLPRIQTNNGGSDLRLAFLTLKPTDYQTDPATDLGDVCYVEYRFFNNALWRAFRGSGDTFDSLSRSNRFPVIPTPQANPESWEIVATNLYQFKVWAHSPSTNSIPLDANGLQTTYWVGSGPFTNLALSGIEYQMEVLDQKYMKMYRDNPQLAEAQGYKSRKYYQAIKPVPSH